MRNQGRMALVTGGASGIGAATARRLATGGAALAIVLAFALSTVAGAAPRPATTRQDPFPLRVHFASLRQDGLRLVWSLRTDAQFSPNELGRDHRRLCLLIERVSARVAVGELCIRVPGSRRRPQLDYRHLTRSGAGPARTIAATVMRANAQEMTASFLPASIGVGYRPLRWQVLSTTFASACATGSSAALACAARFPAFPALASLHTPRPVGCTASGPPFVFSGSSARRVVALTFDDGPWPDTPAFLKVLERERVPATFFQIGEQVGSYGGGVERRMLADGDMIGDHTWSHADVSGAGRFAAAQISQTAAAIRRATGGFTPCLFRAPYGAYSRALIGEARGMGFTTIEWNVDPTDWSRPGTEAIYQRVVSAVRAGAIVIQHDGGGDRSQTLAALPREIDTLKARGYRFVTITQLLGDRILYR